MAGENIDRMSSMIKEALSKTESENNNSTKYYSRKKESSYNLKTDLYMATTRKSSNTPKFLKKITGYFSKRNRTKLLEGAKKAQAQQERLAEKEAKRHQEEQEKIKMMKEQAEQERIAEAKARVQQERQAELKAQAEREREAIKSEREKSLADSQNNEEINGTHYKSKKGLLGRLKEKLSNRDFKKKLVKRTAAVITTVGLTFVGGMLIIDNLPKEKQANSYEHTENLEYLSGSENNAEKSTTIPAVTDKIETEIENNIEDAQSDTPTVDEFYYKPEEDDDNIDSKQTDIEATENIYDETVEDMPEKVAPEINNAVTEVKMRDLLMVTLNVGFDTEFRMDTGKFYETPDGTGRYGNYENIGTNIKINMVDAIKDGNFVCYRVSSGMSLADIYADADQVVSAHTTTSDGSALGWNVNMDDIEKNIINSELSRIKENLPQEVRDYIDSIDLDAPVDINNKDMIKNLARIKIAQKSVNGQEKDIEMDEQSR